MARGQFGEIEAGDRGRIRERLAVVARQPRHDLERVRLDHELVVVGREALGDDPRKADLVEVGVGVGKANGESLHGFAALIGHCRHDRARVDAAGEKRTQWNLANQTDAGGLPKQLAQASLKLVIGRVRLRHTVFELPIAPGIHALRSHQERGCRGQLLHAGKCTVRVRDVLVGEVVGDRLQVRLALDLRVLEQRHHLGGEPHL